VTGYLEIALSHPIAAAAFKKSPAGMKPCHRLRSKIKTGGLKDNRYRFDSHVKQAGLVNLT
jgi:hypothetical protein